MGFFFYFFVNLATHNVVEIGGAGGVYDNNMVMLLAESSDCVYGEFSVFYG